mmetsp:Transcript_12465/g.26380  ORF Transcript_12465/g.26380 Transcript_12465/m.26380 type:complete len:80 (-) Transcript_12465:260-499(-)
MRVDNTTILGGRYDGGHRINEIIMGDWNKQHKRRGIPKKTKQDRTCVAEIINTTKIRSRDRGAANNPFPRQLLTQNGTT